MEPLIIRHVNVVTMDQEGVLEDQQVRIENGLITAITPETNGTGDLTAKQIDGTELYLIPGLTDMHVHLIDQVDYQSYLPYGVTTVRNMWGPVESNTLRDKINKGEVLGPNLFNCSPIMDGDPPARPVDEHNITLKTPEEAVTAVKQAKEDGFDYIKVYDNLPLDIYLAIMKTSKGLGMPVAGHVPYQVGIEAVIEQGQASIEHQMYVSPDHLDLLQEGDTWVCVTHLVHDLMDLSVITQEEIDHRFLDPRRQYLSKENLDMWDIYRDLEKARTMYESFHEKVPYILALLENVTKENSKRFHTAAQEKGLKLLLGTDTPNPFLYPGYSLHDEMAALVRDFGWTPFQVLQMGTVFAAEFLRCLDTAGSITKGKQADLVLLAGNPLEDISQTANIKAVIKSGQYLHKDTLDQILEHLASSYAAEAVKIDKEKAAEEQAVAKEKKAEADKQAEAE